MYRKISFGFILCFIVTIFYINLILANEKPQYNQGLGIEDDTVTSSAIALGSFSNDDTLSDTSNGDLSENYYYYSDDGNTLIFNEKTQTITGCIANSPDIIVPESINNISVRAIGENAFSWDMSISGSVTLPDTVTEIGDYAFTHCYLKSIKLPNNLTSYWC